jgi:hypothetical protein
MKKIKMKNNQKNKKTIKKINKKKILILIMKMTMMMMKIIIIKIKIKVKMLILMMNLMTISGLKMMMIIYLITIYKKMMMVVVMEINQIENNLKMEKYQLKKEDVDGLNMNIYQNGIKKSITFKMKKMMMINLKLPTSENKESLNIKIGIKLEKSKLLPSLSTQIQKLLTAN